MSTTQVSPAELSAMAHQIRAAARSIEQAAPKNFAACGRAGRPAVEQAHEAFVRQWESYVLSCEAAVSRLSQLVELAAEAYEHQDGSVASAAAVSTGSRR